jgi:hypothetical protein
VCPYIVGISDNNILLKALAIGASTPIKSKVISSSFRSMTSIESDFLNDSSENDSSEPHEPNTSGAVSDEG